MDVLKLICITFLLILVAIFITGIGFGLLEKGNVWWGAVFVSGGTWLIKVLSPLLTLLMLLGMVQVGGNLIKW